MKFLFTVIGSIFSLALSAQTIQFKIDGTIESNKNAKYAYLTTLSQQIPISSDKIFIKVPVINGHFEFNGNFELEGRNLQFANIFFDERDNITKDEIALKFKNIIWVSGRDNHIVRMILENMTLQVKGKDEAKGAIIIENGILTKQFNVFSQFLRNDDVTKLIAFIKANSDSPISLNALDAICSFYKDDLKNLNETIPNLFNILSPKIKEGKDGQEMKKKWNIK